MRPDTTMIPDTQQSAKIIQELLGVHSIKIRTVMTEVFNSTPQTLYNWCNRDGVDYDFATQLHTYVVSVILRDFVINGEFSGARTVQDRRTENGRLFVAYYFEMLDKMLRVIEENCADDY